MLSELERYAPQREKAYFPSWKAYLFELVVYQTVIAFL